MKATSVDASRVAVARTEPGSFGMRRVCCQLYTAAIALVACGVPAQASELEAEISRLLTRHGIVGGACVVIREGEIDTITAHGVASLDEEQPVNTDTRFRAGSVSKTLTTLLTLRLSKQDVVDLDAPIARKGPHLPVDNAWGETAPVTLGNLLEHTAGLPGSSYRDYATSVPNASGQAFLDHSRGLRCRWPPGTFFSYSNNGYGLVGAVLEEVTGESFDALMEREVFEPLGIASGSFRNDVSSVAQVATSYDRSRQPQPTWTMVMRPAGSLTITAKDLAKIVQMLIDRGVTEDGTIFLPRELVDRMEQSKASLAAAVGVDAGSYALGQFGYVIDGRLWRGHWGKTDGFLTNYGYLPKQRVGFVTMINTDAPAAMTELRSLLADHLVDDSPPPERPQVCDAVTGPDPSGYYVSVTHDMPMRDWLFRMLDQKRISKTKDGYLVESVGPHGSSAETHRQTLGGAFISESIPVPTAAFVRHRDKYYWVDGEAYERVSAAEAELRRCGFLASLVSAAWLLIQAPIASFLRRRRRPIDDLVSEGKHDRLAIWRSASGVLASVGLLATTGLFVRFGLLGNASDLRLMGTVSWVSLAIAATTLAFGISCLLHLALTLAAIKKRSSWVSWLRLVPAIPLAGVALLWIGSGWMPLLTWR